MTLQTFIRAGRLIYQVKIRGGSSYSREEVMGGSCFDQELEDIIRTVLGNLDSLQPFSSAHFNVFPYKKQWEGGSNVLCQQYERKLRVYPFILHLYLERNMQNSEEEHTFTACSGKSSAEQFSPVSFCSVTHITLSSKVIKCYQEFKLSKEQNIPFITKVSFTTGCCIGLFHNVHLQMCEYKITHSIHTTPCIIDSSLLCVPAEGGCRADPVCL
uniref:Uncharacterized protein n=1 Tax=Sparus aurata TaxID=8175 RepID=A0A671TL18_SPAAU